MIARRLWTIESCLPEVLSRHSGVGRRGWMRACASAKKKAALGQPLMLCSAGDQTTASCFSFFTCMNCSRLTPSHMTSGLATRTEE